MMDHNAYNSSNENGLLKFFGPYRIMTSDESLTEVIIPAKKVFISPLIIGKVKLYGEEIEVKDAAQSNQ